MKLKRKKIDPTNCTLLELAYARTGSMLKAARVSAYAVAWAICTEDLGHAPTMEEYCEWWREPVPTAYRHRAEFRAVTGLEDPTPIVELWERQRQAKRDSRTDLSGLVTA